jgi:hypothetical protein
MTGGKTTITNVEEGGSKKWSDDKKNIEPYMEDTKNMTNLKKGEGKSSSRRRFISAPAAKNTIF